MEFLDGHFMYSIFFENEEKTKGFFNWTPKEFPYNMSNAVSFTEKDDLFLLETSSAGNLATFKKIIHQADPAISVSRFKPLVGKEDIQTVFGEALQYMFEHDKGWYIACRFAFGEQPTSLDYSPLTGKGNTSMCLTEEFREKLIHQLLVLFHLNTEGSKSW